MVKLVTIDFLGDRNYYTFKVDDDYSFEIQASKHKLTLVGTNFDLDLDVLNEAFTIVAKYEKVGNE